ncbi:ABC transporter G family member 23 isoform X5 [Phyllopteryx taeniolatus]|uniref:ABC transporter G family member 23 isoform X5 n=1 Tax=Phyllopteryx taeniolatus TaxID=161469 RepID=UPI002AD3FFB5|nr:ABC transporter G family member 23 isoform X5 [Phyllopteryx taeniolatus]
MPAEEEAAAGRQHATRADCTEMGDRKKREMKGDVEASPAPTLGEPAVRCQDVCRSYGKLKVLDNLNLTLPQGQIYGLLGPSGCGKTTMLKCIVGTLSISRGRISVLGKPPAFPGHGVPGRMVGYMPQELALYNEFTIGDTLAFYGRIHGLTLRETQARVSFLIEFLDLPQKDRLVRNLSGGQKRRVSLGAALLQKPELLILDEPTVGVDPVLRAKIWQHLADIVKEGKVSVIITTHYIEEARQANVVGLMRNGCLLAEGTPEALMKMHGSSTLEHAFLRLCETSDQTGVKRGAGSRDDASGNSRSFESGRDQSRHVLLDVPKAAAEVVSHTVDWKVRVQHVIPKWRNIAALTIKTLLRMKRMPGSLCFQFLLPVIQMSLICLCVGGDPKGIRVAVVNNETSAIAFSPSLLSFLDNSSVEQVSLSHAEAFRGIGDGKYWAVIGFSKNFSACLVNRMFQKNVSRETINGGSVHVWLDQTNRQIALMLQQKLYEAFQAFVENKLGVMAYMYALPIKFEEAIYGSQNTDFTTFVMPGAVLRRELAGDDAGSPFLAAAGHRRPDCPHAALRPARLQDAERRLPGSHRAADRAAGHHRHLLRPRHLRRHRRRAERQPGRARTLLPQPHHERYHLAGGVHPLPAPLPQPGAAPDLRLRSAAMHHVQRLGSDSHDGLARLRGHSGLEHVLHCRGDPHLEVPQVNACARCPLKRTMYIHIHGSPSRVAPLFFITAHCAFTVHDQTFLSH